jgi:hypothetical protein
MCLCRLAELAAFRDVRESRTAKLVTSGLGRMVPFVVLRDGRQDQVEVGTAIDVLGHIMYTKGSQRPPVSRPTIEVLEIALLSQSTMLTDRGPPPPLSRDPYAFSDAMAMSIAVDVPPAVGSLARLYFLLSLFSQQVPLSIVVVGSDDVIGQQVMRSAAVRLASGVFNPNSPARGHLDRHA